MFKLSLLHGSCPALVFFDYYGSEFCWYILEAISYVARGRS